MARRLLHWLPILSIIALLVALVPAGALAQSPQAAPTVNGLFYGDGDWTIYQVYGVSPPEPGSTRTRGTLYKYYDPGTGLIHFAMVVDRSVNDNVFGNKSNGQPDRDYLDSGDWGNNGHMFSDLLGSDAMQFQITCGTNVWDWWHGYIYDADGDLDPAEADWLSGPEDPSDGSGTWPTSLESDGSLAWNMNYGAANMGDPNVGWDVTLASYGLTARAYADWKSPASGAESGQISHIDVTNGGNGYTEVPTVVINDPTGTGATAIAQLLGGKVTWVHVTNPGSGYTLPTVSFLGGGGAGAAATAVLGPTDESNDPRVTDEEGYPPVSEQPADNITFDATHGWEWPLVYEFAFDLSECGGAPFTLASVNAHNSPSKDASEDVPLSVELLSFDAEVLPGGGHTRSIAVSWETANEVDNVGFNLYRATSIDGLATKVNPEMIWSTAAGGGGAVYEYVDEGLAKKTTYYYWLEDVDMYGTATWSDPIAVTTTGKGRGNK